MDEISTFNVDRHSYQLVNENLQNLETGYATKLDNLYYVKLTEYTPTYLISNLQSYATTINLFTDNFRVEDDTPTLEFPSTTTSLTVKQIIGSKYVIFGKIARRHTTSYFDTVFGAALTSENTFDFNNIISISDEGVDIERVFSPTPNKSHYFISDDFIYINFYNRSLVSNLDIQVSVEKTGLIQQAVPRLKYVNAGINLKNDLFDVPAYSDVSAQIENTDGLYNSYINNSVLGAEAQLILVRLNRNEHISQSENQIIRNGRIRSVSSDDSSITLGIGDELRNFEKDVLTLGSDLGFNEISDTPMPIAYGRNTVQAIPAEDNTNRYIFADPNFAEYKVNEVFYYENNIKKNFSYGFEKRPYFFTNENGIVDFKNFTFLDTGNIFFPKFMDVVELYFLVDGMRVLIDARRYSIDDMEMSHSVLDKKITFTDEEVISEDGELVDFQGFYVGPLHITDLYRNIEIEYAINTDVYVDFISNKSILDVPETRAEAVLMPEENRKYTVLNSQNENYFLTEVFYFNNNNKITIDESEYVFVDGILTLQKYEKSGLAVSDYIALSSYENVSAVYFEKNGRKIKLDDNSYYYDHVTQTVRFIRNRLNRQRDYILYIQNLDANRPFIIEYTIKNPIFVFLYKNVSLSGGIPSNNILRSLVETYTDLTFHNNFDAAEISSQTFHNCNFYATGGTLIDILQTLTTKAFLYFFVNKNNKYTIRQYDFEKVSDETLTANIALTTENNNLNYASTVRVNYNIDSTLENKKDVVYSDSFYQEAIFNFREPLIKKYDSILVERDDAQKLAHFLAERLASKNTNIEIETTQGYYDLSLYDKVLYDGRRGNDQVLDPKTYYVFGLDLIEGKVKLKELNV